MENLLNLHGFSIVGREALEVGCYGGAHTFAMVELGAKHVDGIDIPAYGVRQSLGKNMDLGALERQSRWLQRLRESTAGSYKDEGSSEYSPARECRTPASERTDFFDLDVAELDRDSAYDVIVSWYTLEHITRPEKAILNMYRALRPGGICFHDYNPFFSINGAHSLCTLDFPYGHARLSDADFERYMRTYRPQEYDVAMSFYHESLNRMSLAGLQHHCAVAGFEILELIEWRNRKDMRTVVPTVLSQCVKFYPTVTVTDLISRSVWVLLRRPAVSGE